MKFLPSLDTLSGGFGGLGADGLSLLNRPIFQINAMLLVYSWNGISPVIISMAARIQYISYITMYDSCITVFLTHGGGVHWKRYFARHHFDGCIYRMHIICIIIYNSCIAALLLHGGGVPWNGISPAIISMAAHKSSPIYMSHDRIEWVVSHMKESCLTFKIQIGQGHVYTGRVESHINESCPI